MRLSGRRGLRAMGVLVALGGLPSAFAASVPGLPGASMLADGTDRSEEMRAGIERYLDRELAAVVAGRAARWPRDASSPEAYARSVAAPRARLAQVIGAVEPRVPSPELAVVRRAGAPPPAERSAAFAVQTVRWPVFGTFHAEGVLLQPAGPVRARIVVLPDADQTPEQLCGLAPGLPVEAQAARRLAEQGCQVLVPALVSRADTHSGSAGIGRFTNQPHREWIYRQAYTMGRHVIGYEVQSVLAGLDWLARQPGAAPLGLAGWGEGGLVALYTAALDPRVAATLVSGYFGPREALWAEPIYRNCFGLLRDFGDAEIASLVAPRTLLVEPAPPPRVDGPPVARPGVRAAAATGAIVAPPAEAVRAEVGRARHLCGPFGAAVRLLDAPGAPLHETSVRELLRALIPDSLAWQPPQPLAPASPADDVVAARQQRLVHGLTDHTQALLASARELRDAAFWKSSPITAPEAWHRTMQPKRDAFWGDLNGRLPRSEGPLNVRARVLFERPDSIGYEVVLDALPDATLWGYLLVPRSLAAGERRPVVVTQHGLSGVSADLLNEDPTARASRVYHAFASQLVRRGYVVFAPHFPWRAQEDYRRLQRKANPLGLSVFSFILAHHTRLLDWLETLPFVDRSRIGLYGLSWGGKVAMRVPALETRYALSICSGDFNEWIWKNATVSWPNSYMYSPESDMFDFNLGPTFGHAEMAAMIAPRPFMVERGHDDGVGIDEMVALEFSRVRRLYAKLQIPERATIEFFNGGHEIRAVGTFQFLQRHFNWPASAPQP